MNNYLANTEDNINESLFKIKQSKMGKKRKEKALKELFDYEFTQKKTFLGYQVNEKFDYKTNYSDYLNIHLNNVGDPFVNGNLTTNTKFVEREVLKYYSKLWNNKNRNEKKLHKDSFWGYIVSMGCTEANIFGLMSGRDYLEGKYLLIDEDAHKNAKAVSLTHKSSECRVNTQLVSSYGELVQNKSKNKEDNNKNRLHPIAFYSQDTHYSIVKAMEILTIDTFSQMAKINKYKCPLKYPQDYPKNFSKEYLDKNNWPKEVPSNNDGSVYIPALKKLVEFFASMGYPILICFNYGTTFKGAYDDVKGAVDELVPILKKYDLYEREIEYDTGKTDKRNGFWFHVDGALGSAYMPFIEEALKKKLITKPSKDYKFPKFDFKIKEIHSISMSGHKWIGCPWPTGIYMSKVKYQLKPVDDPMYIGSPDTTFAGSRNGFSALVFWEYLSNKSYMEHVQEAVRVEELARYAYKELKTLDKDGLFWVQRGEFSLTIRFKKPSEDIIFKYSLSEESLYVDGEQRDYAHIFIMGHVTKKLIKELISDLEKYLI